MSHLSQPSVVVEKRRPRCCPSCGATGMIRGCRVPGVQIQVVTDDGHQRSGLIGLYSDVCVECGLTSFYARREEVTGELEKIDRSSGEPHPA